MAINDHLKPTDTIGKIINLWDVYANKKSSKSSSVQARIAIMREISKLESDIYKGPYMKQILGQQKTSSF